MTDQAQSQDQADDPGLGAAAGSDWLALQNRQRINQDRDETAARLRALSEDPRFSTRREELAALSGAVAVGDGQEALWRGTDLFSAFPADATVTLSAEGGRSRRLSIIVGVLAGVVVFLPVFWTWLSLRKATLAYEAMIAHGAGAGASFIQLWTTGFEGRLAHHFRLPEVAFGSVAIILLSMALIASDRWLARKAAARQEHEFDECAAKLASALTRASLTINSRTVEDPIKGLDIVAEAARGLMDANVQTERAARQLTDAADGLRRTINTAKADLEGSVSAVEPALGQAVGSATDSLNTMTSDVAASLLGSVSSVASDLKQSVGATAKSLKDATDRFTASLVSSSDRMTESIKEAMSDAAATLHDAVRGAVSDLNGNVSELARVSAGIRTSVTESTQAQQDLTKATEAIHLSIDNLEQRIESALDDMLNALSEKLEAFAKESSHIAKSTDHVGTSLGDHTAALQHQISELTQIRASLTQLAGQAQRPSDGLTATPTPR